MLEITPELIWLLVGFAGQGVFFLRFVIQWWRSEQAKDSVVPISFWYLSIVGATIILAYAAYRQDPVFIAGQALALVIYARNLVLIRRATKASHDNGTQ
jgi:lipid-A-disaccharide synthase-like uncharacterized protein